MLVSQKECYSVFSATGSFSIDLFLPHKGKLKLKKSKFRQIVGSRWPNLKKQEVGTEGVLYKNVCFHTFPEVHSKTPVSESFLN